MKAEPDPPPTQAQPGAPDLPEVRLAHCGCILSANAPPVGYRFKATEFGDVRVSVFACREHTKLSSALESDDLPLKKPKPKRAAKSSPSKGTKPRPKSSDDQYSPEHYSNTVAELSDSPALLRPAAKPADRSNPK